MKSAPHRQRRLDKLFDTAPCYFLTLCTKDREQHLDNDPVMQRVYDFATDSFQRYGVYIDCFVLMPDHAHLITTISASSKTTIGSWVKAFKAVVANREFKWQPGFFDHVLRNDESRSEKWEYIRMNPVRAGLVSSVNEWPYSKQFNRRNGTAL